MTILKFIKSVACTCEKVVFVFGIDVDTVYVLIAQARGWLDFRLVLIDIPCVAVPHLYRSFSVRCVISPAGIEFSLVKFHIAEVVVLRAARIGISYFCPQCRQVFGHFFYISSYAFPVVFIGKICGEQGRIKSCAFACSKEFVVADIAVVH